MLLSYCVHLVTITFTIKVYLYCLKLKHSLAKIIQVIMKAFVDDSTAMVNNTHSERLSTNRPPKCVEQMQTQSMKICDIFL